MWNNILHLMQFLPLSQKDNLLSFSLKELLAVEKLLSIKLFVTLFTHTIIKCYVLHPLELPLYSLQEATQLIHALKSLLNFIMNQLVPLKDILTSEICYSLQTFLFGMSAPCNIILLLRQ